MSNSRRVSLRGAFWFVLVCLLQLTTQPLLISAAEPLPGAVLTLSVTGPTEPVKEGSSVRLNIDVRNTASNPLTNVVLMTPHHEDFVYVAADPYVVSGHGVALGTVAGGENVQITLQTQVQGVPRQAAQLPFSVRAAESDSTRATVTVAVQAADLETAALAGGQTMAFAQGQVVLDLSKSAVPDSKHDVQFQLQERHQREPGDAGPILGFVLTAVGDSPELAATMAAADIRLDVNRLVTSDALASGRLQLYTRRADNTPWQKTPFTVDAAGGMITVSGQTWGEFLLLTEPEPWEFTYTPPGASTFSGSAQFSHAIKVPPGVGGLAPGLSLNYNSRSVDNLRDPIMARGFGLGWGMPQMEITSGNASEMYDGTEEEWDDEEWDVCGFFSPARFTLQINGASHTLHSASGARYGKYVAIGDPSLDIEYRTDAPGNITGEYWLVRTADGTQYKFGYSEGAEQVVSPLKEQCPYVSTGNSLQPRNRIFAAASWKLDTIVDKFGNQIVYHYAAACGQKFAGGSRLFPLDGGGQHCTEVDVAVTQIQYNFTNGTPATPQTIIHFENSAILNDGPWRNKMFMTVGRYRPSGLRIEHNGVLSRRYDFAYELPDPDNPGSFVSYYQHRNAALDYNTSYWWLTKIIEKGADGTTNLPATTFHYEQQTANSCGPNPAGNTRCAYLLTKVENGYGAVTTLAYSPINNDGVWYPVSDVYTWDGVVHVYGGGNPAAVQTHYDRTGATPCFDKDSTPGCRAPHAEASNSLIGFNQVKLTAGPPGGAVLSEQRLTFDIGDHNVNYWLNGKVFTSTAYDPANPGRKLSEENSSWDWVQLDENGNGVPDIFFARLQSVENKVYDPTGSGSTMGTRVVHTYDANWQGGRQWGRSTNQKYYSLNNSGSWVFAKQTITYYLANTGNWRLAPWAAGLYSIESSPNPMQTTPLQLTLHYYDNNVNTYPANNQPLTMANLTLSRSLLADQPISPLPPGTTAAYPTTDSRFYYSNHGNVTNVITFKGYGAVGRNGTNWNYATQPGNGSPSFAQTTQYSNDGLLVTYVTNALNHKTDFFYSDTRFPWLPTRIKDPNNINAYFTYDPFGRLYELYDGDANYNNNDPRQRYHYWDNTWNNPDTFRQMNGPFLISVQQRPVSYPNPGVSNGGFALIDQTFYDGLGRPLQTRSIYPEVDGQPLRREIYTTTGYDALGRPVCQTTPFDVPFYYDRGLIWPQTPFITAPCSSADATTTAYDPLGRPLTVTAPDGSRTETRYSVNNSLGALQMHHNVYDANQHRMRYSYDAFGQLAQVTEFTGVCWPGGIYNCNSGDEPWAEYAQTLYAYDLPGNLTSVMDDAGSTTTMTYDALGRKKGMNDPDMGIWAYQYDPAGSMVRQVDSHGRALCFEYDGLSRLLRKAEDDTPATACPATLPYGGKYHLASYTYDTGAYGLGQLWQVKWGPHPADNYDWFTYDGQGRMIRQTRIIDGRSFSMQTNSFDALNQPLSVTYPNGETVTFTYDREGANSLQAGSDQLVSNITYNVRGQMRQFVRPGSLPDTVYEYFNAATEPGGGAGDGNFRLRSINSGSLLDLDYQYDAVGNVATITNNLPGSAEVQRFTYDALNRLETACVWDGINCMLPGGAATVYNHTYEYYENGNIKKYAGATYNYNDVAWNSACPTPVPSQALPHAVRQIGGYYFCYDKNGNMTRRSDKTGLYTQNFDVENRLVSVVNHNGRGGTLFAYDAAGQRVKTAQPEAGLVTYTPFPQYEETVQAGSYQWYFDTGYGDSVKDTSPYRLHGTRTGASWDVGISSNALNFDGVDDYVAFDGTVPIAGAMSVSAWVRPEQGPTGNGRVVASTYHHNGGGVNQRGWLLGDASGSADHFMFSVLGENGVLAEATDTGFFADYQNRWVHVTGVFEPGVAVRLYVNGALVSQDTTNVPTAVGQPKLPLFKIGARADNTSQGFWDGQIDSLQVFSSALNATEVTALAQQYAPQLTLTFTANGQTALTVPPNQSFTLTWQGLFASSCTASGNWSGSKPVFGSQVITGFSSGSRVYTLSCQDGLGRTISQSVTVSILPPPTVDLLANGSPAITVPPQTTFNMTWSSTNATSCTASGSWSGGKPISGSEAVPAAKRDGIYTYTLTCQNAAGSGSDVVTVTVESCSSELCDRSSPAPEASTLGVGSTNSEEQIPGSTTAVASQSSEAESPARDPQSVISGAAYLYQDDLVPWKGAIVALKDATGTIVMATMTGNVGAFNFANVPSGTYKVEACAWVGDDVWHGSRSNVQPPNTMTIVIMHEGSCPLPIPPPAGADTLTIYAAGSPSGGVYPTMELEVDGLTVATYTGVQGDYANRVFEAFTYVHSQPIDLSRVKVKYVNDSGARTLYVDRMVLDGLTYQTEAASTYSTGTWAAADGCAPGYKQSEGLHCNGYVQFVPMTARSSYSLAGQTVATRVTGDQVAANNGLFYLHQDHLGSTSALSPFANNPATPQDDRLAPVAGSVAHYYPFGDWRGAKPTTNPALTDMGFTGHKHNNSGANDLGLIYMNARFYVPSIGRFASADTIVPNPANPQAFNRYSYVENQPLSFTDPSGHCKNPGDCLVDGGGMGNGVTPELLQTAESFMPGFTDKYFARGVSYWDKFFKGALFLGSITPVVGDAIDAVDIGVALSHGDYGGAAVNMGLAILPGSTRAWKAAGNFVGNSLPVIRKYADEAVDGLQAAFRQCSFSADTLVMTDDGLVPISQVPAGEMVLAYNEETGDIGFYPVTAVWAHEDPVVVLLTIEGETLETTPNHPFYTAVGEWVQAGSLQPGDEIRDAAWGTGTVEAVTFLATPQVMYNFTVATAHTYFVGDGQWLVHNSGGCDIFFKNFQTGSGFSGVFDPKTGHFIIRPSGDTLLKDGSVPNNLVLQRGGHGTINRQLTEQGIDSSGTVGFTVFYDGPEQLSVAWNSGSVNSVNFGNYAAPTEYRQAIMDALRQSTGYTVISR